MSGVENFYFNPEIKPPPNTESWEVKNSLCKKDLILKRLALGTIVAVNIAIIAASAFALLTFGAHVIPSVALVSSPFIAGVIWGLADLGIKIGKVNNYNYSNFSNPQLMLGQVVAYTLFLPVTLLEKYFDWTAYHNPEKANKISCDLKYKDLKVLTKKYSTRTQNLGKYGFVSEEQAAKMEKIFKEYKALEKVKKTFEKKYGSAIEHVRNTFGYYDPNNAFLRTYFENESKIKQIETEWVSLRSEFLNHLPHPLINVEPQFSFTSNFLNS